GGDTVGVTDIVARKAVTYQSTMGSGGVVAPDGRQFVVAHVWSDAELSMSSFSLLAADEQWPVGVSGASGNRAVAGHGDGPVGGHLGGDGSQYVAFELDSPLEAIEPAIRLDHGGEIAEWSLPDAAVATLAAPEPTFELDTLNAPDSVSQGEEMRVELTVTNTSDIDGRFLAAVYWPTENIADDDESHIVETTVDAGATTTQSVAIDSQYTTNEDGPVTLRVEGHVAAETEIAVTDAGTPA
ncbi:MAG: hypothetical protein ABEH90_04915, partial [Halolamina sp.]